MSWIARHRRLLLALLAMVLLGVAGCVVLTATVTTRQGVDFVVTEQRLPAYVKGVDFIHRHQQYALIASRIADRRASEAGRALKIFDWTRRTIRRTPPGWPVIDDHVLHTIIRGHGTSDQQADVFTTLSTYAGVPAFWSRVPVDRRRPAVILSFARIDGRWRVFDVANGVVFRTRAGELMTMAELAGSRELVPAAVRSIDVGGGAAYVDVVTSASMPPVPRPLRAELQMPFSRLWHETKVVVGLESTDESAR